MLLDRGTCSFEVFIYPDPGCVVRNYTYHSVC